MRLTQTEETRRKTYLDLNVPSQLWNMNKYKLDALFHCMKPGSRLKPTADCWTTPANFNLWRSQFYLSLKLQFDVFSLCLQRTVSLSFWYCHLHSCMFTITGIKHPMRHQGYRRVTAACSSCLPTADWGSHFKVTWCLCVNKIKCRFF